MGIPFGPLAARVAEYRRALVHYEVAHIVRGMWSLVFLHWGARPIAYPVQDFGLRDSCSDGLGNNIAFDLRSLPRCLNLDRT